MRFLAVLLCLAPIAATAQVPNRLGYQGRLLRTDGMPEAGVMPMGFALYDVATGGTPLACDAAQVALSDGYYAIQLGGLGGCTFNPPAISTAVFDGRELYLEVFVGTTPLSPRQRVTSVPYAVRAGTAFDLRGGTVEATAVTVGGATGVAITSTGLSLGGATVVDASGKATVTSGAGLTGDGSTASPLRVATDGVTSGMLANDAASLAKVSGGAVAAASGNVGIGTATPDARLHVAGGSVLLDNSRFVSGRTSTGTAFNLIGVDTSNYLQLGPGVDGLGGIRVFPSQSSGEAMRIASTGSVGIGTDAPKGGASSKNLHVGRRTHLSSRLSDGAANLAYNLYEDAGPYRYIEAAPASLVHLSAAGDFYVYTAAAGAADAAATITPRLFVGGGGNVGIGTSTPAARLDVAGGVRLANDSGPCDATRAGTLRYNAGQVDFCNGTAWCPISASVGTACNPSRSCRTIRDGGGSTGDGTYWLDPNGGSAADAFQAYCDMTTDGGGWTLVRVDDAVSKAGIKNAGAVGTMPSTRTCSGTNVKFADSVIKLIWSERMRYTVLADTNGDMVYFSDANLLGITSWSDQCGSNNKIFWYFKRAPSVLSPTGTHPEYCGWSFGPCNTAGVFCWYGPHESIKVHMNSSGAHISVPANIAALGSEQGCGFGWVR